MMGPHLPPLAPEAADDHGHQADQQQHADDRNRYDAPRAEARLGQLRCKPSIRNLLSHNNFDSS